MRALLVGIVLALGLAGCGTFTPAGEIPVSQSLTAAAQATQTAINEGNVLITAAAQVVAQNEADDIVTPAEALAQIATLRERAKELDRAQRMLDAGDVLSAQDKAELAHKAITALHREVTARLRRTP